MSENERIRKIQERSKRKKAQQKEARRRRTEAENSGEPLQPNKLDLARLRRIALIDHIRRHPTRSFTAQVLLDECPDLHGIHELKNPIATIQTLLRNSRLINNNQGTYTAKETPYDPFNIKGYLGRGQE